MDKRNLFRLALVSNSHAPQTLNKYIVLLSELVIIESKKSSFRAIELSVMIRSKYELEFSDEEIRKALKYDKDFVFSELDNSYSLTLEAIQKIKKNSLIVEKTFNDYLNDFIEIYHNDKERKEKNSIKEIISQYIYFAFNSGKRSLSALILHNAGKRISEEFQATDEEKSIVNEFLIWINPGKNECIYNIVSYALDYGMLTAKKDMDTYKKIFENINFYLDSNIIFRLIGMNNLERQEVTKHFVNKCNEVGIKLCYTNFTYQEICNAIHNTVNYMKALNNGNVPLAPDDISKLGDYDNKDWYDIYYNWCKESSFNYDNYQAYFEYLMDKVNDCLAGFCKDDINNAEFTESKKDFHELSKGLMLYKNQRNPLRHCTIQSAKIDVNNFMFIRTINDSVKQSPIRHYIISADWRLYNWAATVAPAVATVFLPSDWLSIILKYTSRTEADYETFCKFMNLRFGNNERQKEQTMNIIASINELTSDTEIKSKIINQITQMKVITIKDDFSGEQELVKKAFDIVLEEEKNKLEQDSKIQLNAQKEESKSDTNKAISVTARTIAEGIVNEKMKSWFWIKKYMRITKVLVSTISFVVFIIISKVSSIENFIYEYCKTSNMLKGNEYNFAIVFSAIIAGVLCTLMTVFVNYMCSEERKQRILLKQIAKLNKMTQTEYLDY